MARVSAEERAGATTVLLSGEGVPLDDVEQAFEDWRTSFENAEEPGKIRAFQVPIDERGAVQLTSKTQIRLGSWPIDLYSFDELCSMLIRDFMVPAGERIMAVRLIGTKAGERGVNFNKIVILRPPAGSSAPTAVAPESTAALLKAFSEMNERTMAMMQRIADQQRPAPVDATQELTRMLAVAQQLNNPINELMKVLLPVMMGRTPAAAPDPFSGLTGVLDIAERIADLKGGGGSTEGDGGADTVTGIIKSLVPIAKPALEAIPAILAQQPRPVALPPRPAPVPRPASAPGSQPTPPAPGSQPTAPAAPAATSSSNTMADIPSGDQEMFAQLKPQIDSLVQMAGQGADPTAAADLLFDQVIVDLPDQFYEKVADIITGPNFVQQAAVFNPAVLQHKEFFEKFRAQIDKRFTDEDAQAGQQPTGE